MNFEEYYGSQINQVFEDSPVMLVGNALLGKYKNTIYTTDFLHMYMKLTEQWKQLKTYNVPVSVELTDVEEYSINFDMREILSPYIKKSLETPYKSVALSCTMNGNQFEIDFENYLSETIEQKNVIAQSYNDKSVIILFTKDGIDVFGDGVHILDSSKTNIYSSINGKPLKPIEFYKELLKGFYEDHIKFDRTERYLLKNTTFHKEWKELINSDPFILINKPEKKFQIDLSLYLRNNCSDTILKEVINEDEDRYDIWVSNSDQEIYIFEIKWIGRSITETGNFTEYKSDRAVQGAYQLYHYLKSAKEKGEINPRNIIRQGVLLIFDARKEDEEIVYPEKLKKEINLDLDNQLRLEPKLFVASSAHKFYKE